MSVVQGFRLLALALDSCGIPFSTVGSVASSARGVPRSTLDVDILAFFPASKVSCFVAALGADWYADEDSIRQALRNGRSFNVIYNPAVYKFDIFPAVSHFHTEQLSRSTFESFEFAGERVRFPVLSAEDVVLSKLVWYKKSGGTLSRQLEDIRGVLAVNPQIDRDYLREGARELGVADLLADLLNNL